jgi:hypothetical protein
MNKFYLLLTAICVSFYANVSGQCTPNPGVTSGVSPTSASVPCADRGLVFSQTFTFVVPSASVGVQSVSFDSITNLPAGLTYAFDQNPAFYNGGTKGCFIISGTTSASAACGQYKMRIYVTINSLIGVQKGPMDSLAALAGITGYDPIYLRVKESAGICPTVNNNNQLFTADATCGIASGGAPVATTTAATGITQNAATLNGIVNANGLTTAVSFEWGPNTSYGNTLTATPSSITGATGINVSAVIASGLLPSTTYHFRVKGINSSNTTNGNDLTFTTLAPVSAGNCNPNVSQTTLFEPAPDQISCIRQGQLYNEVLYINFTPIANLVTFDSVKIDSFGNMPAGISAYPNQLDKTYLDTESGCIQITGTSNASCGQYRFRIYVTIWSPLLPNPIKGELYNIATQYGFSAQVPVYYHRITACPAPTCPPLDDTQTADFVAALTCTNPGQLTLPVITANGPTTFCQGNSVVLSTGSYAGYEWSNGSTDSTAVATVPGIYNVTVSNGCVTGSATTGINVTVNPSPTATFSATGNSLTALPAVANYKWLKDGSPISGATSQNYTITLSGNYSVIVTIGGCSDTSATQNITFVGIDEVTGIRNLSLVPNPANSQITVRAFVSGGAVREITVHDIVGRIIKTLEVNHVAGSSFEHKIDLNGISNGTYFIQLTTEKGKVTRSFVKN